MSDAQQSNDPQDANLKDILSGKKASKTSSRQVVSPPPALHARIKVMGVGGGGGNALNRMIRSHLGGIEFMAVNTDAQALSANEAPTKINIGKVTSRGLGAGSIPDVGRQAAEESTEDIKAALEGTDMLFITCGLGGGTGTGASPVIAEIAKDMGILTVAVVTKPFSFEGHRRKTQSEEGLENLRHKVDTMIVIPNDKILSLIDRKTSLQEAFTVVDDVLRQGVEGIANLITIHGLINVDFADVKTIMENAGPAIMGIGYGSGENRASEAAQAAIDSPLLEVDIKGAKGLLFNITGGSDLSMFEVDEAARIITDSADPEANIIFGVVTNDNFTGELKVTVVATGFEEHKGRTSMARPLGEFRPNLNTVKRAATAAPRPVAPAPSMASPAPSPVSNPAPAMGAGAAPMGTADKPQNEFDIPPFFRQRMGKK